MTTRNGIPKMRKKAEGLYLKRTKEIKDKISEFRKKGKLTEEQLKQLEKDSIEAAEKSVE